MHRLRDHQFYFWRMNQYNAHEWGAWEGCTPDAFLWAWTPQVSFKLPSPNKSKGGFPSPRRSPPKPLGIHKGSHSPGTPAGRPRASSIPHALALGELPLVFTPPPHLARLRQQSIAARNAGHLNALTIKNPLSPKAAARPPLIPAGECASTFASGWHVPTTISHPRSILIQHMFPPRPRPVGQNWRGSLCCLCLDLVRCFCSQRLLPANPGSMGNWGLWTEPFQLKPALALIWYGANVW